MDAILSASLQHNQPQTEAPMDALLNLPSLVLDTRAQGGARRTRACLQRLAEGKVLDEAMESKPQDNGNQHTRSHQPAQYRRAHRVHRLLTHSSISCAARCLEEQPPFEYFEVLLHHLQFHHPPEVPPTFPPPNTPPAVITEEILGKVMKALPHGSAAGLSEWTYEHIKAATTSSEDAKAAVLCVIQAVGRGDLPHLPRLWTLASSLLPSRLVASGALPSAKLGTGSPRCAPLQHAQRLEAARSPSRLVSALEGEATSSATPSEQA
jgi:hypothetical protein